jgi:hypothetical protein
MQLYAADFFFSEDWSLHLFFLEEDWFMLILTSIGVKIIQGRKKTKKSNTTSKNNDNKREESVGF